MAQAAQSADAKPGEPVIEVVRKISSAAETILEMDLYMNGIRNIRGNDGVRLQTLRITPDPRTVEKYRREIGTLASRIKELAIELDRTN